MIVGMDFGTTNSGMAVYDGRTINTLPLDPTNANPRVLRTAIYVTNEQNIHIGREAIDTYFTQNLGRAVKTRKVWVGEIEVHGADMFYVTDLYVYVDVLSPGRLFLSIKSSLRDSDYPGSVVGQHFYALENLISLYMSVTKLRAERLLGRELTRLVLGRPVRFASDPEKDRLAQARLLRAAFNAGYETVYLQPEPIAAAFSYETTLSRPQNVLVFDFGGGTLDLTVMRLGDPGQRKVLATGGIPIAGDIFDQKLVRAKLPRHFGEGSYYGPRHKQLQVPPWIYDTFSNWQTMLELQTMENKRILRQIAQTAQRRYQIEALQSLASSNYGLQMFDIIELAKRTLSTKRGATIKLEGEGFKVLEFVTRSDFENIIRNEIMDIEGQIDETIQLSGLAAAQIDAVIRTGGSSEIPAFHEILGRKFGPEKVHAVDTFSSVTAGLGVIGHGIAAGEIAAKPHRAAALPLERAQPGPPPKVPAINLDLLQRRIQIQEGEVTVSAAPKILVALGKKGAITAHPLPLDFEWQESISLAGMQLPAAVGSVLVTDMDAPLLIISSRYRFLIYTARQLLEQKAMEVNFDDVVPLAERETLCTISDWMAIKQQPNLLIVTSLGLARPYPLRVLQEQIDAPIPLQFDHPLNGDPVLAAGSGAEQTLVLVTETGKGLRVHSNSLRGSGSQLVNCGTADRIATAALVADETELLLVTADGYGRRLPASWIPEPVKLNAKGRSLVSRRSKVAACTAVTDAQPVWTITNQRLLPVAVDDLIPGKSTKTHPFLKLDNGEEIITLLPNAPVPEG